MPVVEAYPPHSAISAGLSSSQRQPSVLVVDDERLNRELLRAMLARHGFQPLLAASGEEALAMLRCVAPDLVLLDVVMEPMNGYDVLRAIREQWRDTELPVVMVTAEAERGNIVEAFRSGANDYVTKPLDPEVTLARISLHLRLRRAQAELERSQERYLIAAEGSRIGLWDWDVAHRQLFLSKRWKEMLGYLEHELPNEFDAWYDRIHPADQEQFLGLVQRRDCSDQERFECELRMLHRDGSYRWMQCSGIILGNDHGQPRRLAGSLADITEGKVRDVLTGLPNRLLFEERVESALRHETSGGNLSAVLFLDLDKFKIVNDSLGHAAGDLLLCSVARRLEQCLQGDQPESPGEARCCVARHGGDEFTVLVERLSSTAEAEAIAASIIRVLSEPFHLGIQEVSIGVSIGIAFNAPELRSPQAALRAADTAMYHAKTQGRGRYQIYDPEMQTLAAARLALENDIRTALREGQFHVVYQPIVALPSGRIDGFEALCRWRHPRGQAVGPDVFIPILESLGLIGELGRFVLASAGRQIQEWNRQLQRAKPLTVTVNCSTREFAQPQFQRDLLNTIAAAGCDPRTLRLEVTESTLMENPEATRTIIADLRRRGVGVGLDDFGTGYSSLSYLHRLPLELLKIDKSFVKLMQRGNESYEIVRTIVALARSLGLQVVAEGVETLEQHNLLAQLGCTHAQGYLYDKPLPADALQTRIAAGLPNYEHLDCETLDDEILTDLRRLDMLLGDDGRLTGWPMLGSGV